MFALRELVLVVADLVNYVLGAYFWIIVIRALMSWVNPDPWNPIVRFLVQLTEPVLRPIRRILPRMPIDLSPMIAGVLVLFVQRVVTQILVRMAWQLG